MKRVEEVGKPTIGKTWKNRSTGEISGNRIHVDTIFAPLGYYAELI